MSFSIIGSGKIGRALAHQFARQSIEVRVANSRGPESIEPLRSDLGSSIIPSTLEDALNADVVIMAVPYGTVPQVATRAADWQGRILVDATNAVNLTDFTPQGLGGRPSTEIIAEAAPTARVVKAFNTLFASILDAEPSQQGGKRVLFLSGNDADARSEVARLIDQLGFQPIDLGTVGEGGLLAQFGGPLAAQNLIKIA